MDIFKFHNPTSPTRLEQGEIINDITSKTWVERYSKAGEFKFVANANTGLRDRLPIGTLISHVDTTEVMIVENHEIAESIDKEPELTISGRGFETFFENRIVGSNKVYPSNDLSDFLLFSDESWNQAVSLINQHILASSLIDDNDAIPYVQALSTVVGTGAEAQRSLKRKELYSSVLDLLKIDDLGIKVVRPGPWSPLGDTDTAIIIHKGADRSGQVIFSNDTGEIESADYLWSNKKLKNAAMVTSKWLEVMVVPAEVTYSRRVMHVDASDIDESYSSQPTAGDFDTVVALMEQRGREALAAQKDVALTKAEISKESVKARYRVDFEVGDLITVHGSYNESSVMRVEEYVEIEDEFGTNGYPTLALV